MRTANEALDIEASYLVILAQYLIRYCAPTQSDFIYFASQNLCDTPNHLVFYQKDSDTTLSDLTEHHLDFIEELIQSWKQKLSEACETSFDGISVSIKTDGYGLDVHYFIADEAQKLSLKNQKQEELAQFLIDISSFDV